MQAYALHTRVKRAPEKEMLNKLISLLKGQLRINFLCLASKGRVIQERTMDTSTNTWVATVSHAHH